MRNFIVLLFVLISLTIKAQHISMPKNRIPVQQDGFFAWVEVYEGEVKTSSLENHKTYYWIKAKQVHSSKGGYHGELLHGEYTALYKTDALKEKGKYDKGLKTGVWKEWYPNGELQRISHWKNGSPKGSFIYYNNAGKIIKREWYKNGKVHGKQITYTDSAETVAKYRKGKLLKPRTRKKEVSSRKKEKLKAEPAQEIPADKDSTLNAEPKKERKKLFRNKKGDTINSSEKETEHTKKKEKKSGRRKEEFKQENIPDQKRKSRTEEEIKKTEKG